MVVTAHIHRLSLRCDQFGADLRLVFRQRFRQRCKTRLQLLVLGLRGQRLRPVQGKIEMAALVIDLANLAGGLFIVVQQLADGLIERIRENLRLLVLEGPRQMFERHP